MPGARSRANRTAGGAARRWLQLGVVALLVVPLSGCPGPGQAIGDTPTGDAPNHGDSPANNPLIYLKQPEDDRSNPGSNPGNPGDSPSDLDSETSSYIHKPDFSQEASVLPPPVEFRAAWVTRWDYRSVDDVKRIIAELARAGFNAVFFQVRGTADAYYRSRLVPWAAGLAGRLGRDPGWDPLQVAIDAADREGMELHAWFNTCTAWEGDRPPGLSQPRHLLRARPNWLLRDRRGRPLRGASGYFFFNPALPAFQQHLEQVVAELISFYHLEGIHFDFIRWPAADTRQDARSRRMYRKARRAEPGLDFATWQRRAVDGLVARLAEVVHRVRPGAEVSAAVFGIWKNRWGWKNVTQGYHDVLQDWLGWARRGLVDALVPMFYWPPSDPPGGRADFATLVREYAPLQKQVRLVAGISVQSGPWPALRLQVELARQHGLAGVAVFSYRLLKDKDLLERFGRELFARPALARPPRQVEPEVSVVARPVRGGPH